MLVQLIIPIVLSAVALFFASFLSWMIFQLHRNDWKKMEQEDAMIDAVRQLNIPRGSYMFPCCDTPEEMKSEAYQQKWKEGPCGIITVYPQVNMGRNLGLTFVYFLVCSLGLAYLASLVLAPGTELKDVFHFMAVAAFMTFLAATVQHAIWFHNRIVGHIIESLAYAIIVGLIFGLMWPAA